MTTGRKVWLHRAYAEHCDTIITFLRGKLVYVSFDETLDDRGWSVLHVLVGTGTTSLLCAVDKMAVCNHATVAQRVVTALQLHQIPMANVLAYACDSASYCAKAVREVLMQLSPRAVHCPCTSHIFNLVAEALCDVNPEVTRFVSLFQGLLAKQTGRRRRLREHMGCLPREHQALPPLYREQRWRTLYDAVQSKPVFFLQTG
jgi:hypothetical protein